MFGGFIPINLSRRQVQQQQVKPEGMISLSDHMSDRTLILESDNSIVSMNSLLVTLTLLIV